MTQKEYTRIRDAIWKAKYYRLHNNRVGAINMLWMAGGFRRLLKK